MIKLINTLLSNLAYYILVYYEKHMCHIKITAWKIKSLSWEIVQMQRVRHTFLDKIVIFSI